MNNLQETFVFPFQDRESWTQFLIACAVMLAAFVIPVLPAILLMGYTMKIMRQVIDERKPPSMPAWQGSDWSEMLLDGLRLFGAQLILTLPLFLLLGGGIILIIGGTVGFSALANEELTYLSQGSGVMFIVGILLITIFALLSLPYGVITAAAQAHVAARRSFTAAFEFQDWWQIFRKGLGQFVLAYVTIMLASFIFTFALQVAMVTIVLICIIPILMIPYSAYLMIVTNTLYAQAYAAARDGLQTP